VKRARWIAPAAFTKSCAGQSVSLDDLISESPIVEHAHTRNTLGRLNETTGDEGSLFTLLEYRIDARRNALPGADWMSVYVRVQPDFEAFLLELFSELADTGFGADASVGMGVFDFPDDAAALERVDALEQPPGEANAVAVLSTFQPGSGDPVSGVWETFTKHGKLGPDFGLDDTRIRKRPLLLCRPGSCFHTSQPRAWLGRAVPMDEVLVPSAAAALRARGVEAVHPAFGLAVSATLTWDGPE
jgi:hypothetical protein